MLIKFYNFLNIQYEKGELLNTRNGFFFLISLSPETPEFWTSLGIVEIERKEFEKAEEVLNHALELDPLSIDVHKALFHLYYTIQNLPKAKSLCETRLSIVQSMEATGELELLLISVKESLDQL